MFELVGQPTLGNFPAVCALLAIACGCTPNARAVSAAQLEPPETEVPDPVTVTVFTEKVELFMEYPRLVPGAEARFLAHVTVLATGEPVRTGSLRIELNTSTADPIVLEAPQPTQDGLFIPVGTFGAPGRYEAQVIVESAQATDTIPLAPVVVHADLSAAFAAAELDESASPRDTVPFSLEQQWRVRLRMEQVTRRTLTRRLLTPGEVEAPPHAMAVVSSPLAGRLLSPEAGRLARIGDRVEKGQVLALLEPPLTTADAAQIAANEASHGALEMELLAREFDIQARALEIEQTLHQSEARLGFAQRALARIEELRGKDLGTIAEHEAARRDVEIAQRGSEGARALQESFAQGMRRLEDLRSRSAAVRADAQASGPRRYELVAPISGEVVAAHHVEGEHVENQGAVYRILDLSRVWIAAHVSEFDLAEIGAAPGALLELAAFPEKTFDVLGGMDGRLARIGRIVDPETRTVPLYYDVANPDELLRAGMFADVFLETQQAVDAIAVPSDAIVMDNGRPVAFALVHGEMFQKRMLELGVRDGGYVEVLSGLQEGDRIATDGAYLVNLAAASPASFGEGHAH